MIDEMWMTRPQRRSFICGTRARVRAMTELRLISSTSSQASSVMASMACGLLVPALLMRMSTRPICVEGGLRPGVRPRRGGSCRRRRSLPLRPVPARISSRAGCSSFSCRLEMTTSAPGLGQAAGHRLAQALAAARHQGHLARQVKKVERHRNLPQDSCSADAVGNVVNIGKIPTLAAPVTPAQSPLRQKSCS